MSQRDALPAQYARWALQLQGYNFNVTHRPGLLHQNADALSREHRASAFDGSGARMDEEGDPARPPPALVQYPGVRWPVYAYSRDRPGQPAPAELECMAAAACAVALAERYQEDADLTDPARAFAAAPAAAGQLAGLVHLAGPVPAARAAMWCVHAVCTVVGPGLPVTTASELELDEEMELESAAGLPAAVMMAIGLSMGPPVAGGTTLRAAVKLVRDEGAALRRQQPVTAMSMRLWAGTGQVLGVQH
ncbi:hypothetical protein GPECTOR_3g162 [Gonium pectorale]|uniref:Reverse transcriptase RNase H-like domain-containing protein n=1 Tax=Gonium pectorale TaxID=33097 RepID=A0A150GZF6_GONPE|nr:hypothetical protein GPECTOR_3g162 [Gonium pectorale]|eukprot:KXZ54998.1 hypothetical protein GPECTOR_3g162 [Gonium pectorale]